MNKLENRNSSTPKSVGTPEQPGADIVSIQSAKPVISPTVIAVTSGKGGVGKTHFSTNLAVSLGQTSARVLCVDADLGLANMDIVMGVAPTYTVRDLLTGAADIEDILIEGSENVWLLPGASGQYDLANLNERQRHDLFSAVDSLDDRFDVVIVDTGAGVSSNAVGFASAAKDIVVVVTPEPTSVADAYGMIKILSTQCNIRRVKLVVNMCSGPQEADRVLQRITGLTDRFLSVSVQFAGFIPKDPLVVRAVMRGEPFTLTHPSCPASNAIRGIANQLIADDDYDDRQGAIRLFWRKLLRQNHDNSGRSQEASVQKAMGS